jgi:hypothetical protein
VHFLCFSVCTVSLSKSELHVVGAALAQFVLLYATEMLFRLRSHNVESMSS